MEGKYADAVRVLQLELQNFPRSRAALSLLGFCYYYLQVRMCVCVHVGRDKRSMQLPDPVMALTPPITTATHTPYASGLSQCSTNV